MSLHELPASGHKLSSIAVFMYNNLTFWVNLTLKFWHFKFDNPVLCVSEMWPVSVLEQWPAAERSHSACLRHVGSVPGCICVYDQLPEERKNTQLYQEHQRHCSLWDNLITTRNTNNTTTTATVDTVLNLTVQVNIDLFDSLRSIHSA